MRECTSDSLCAEFVNDHNYNRESFDISCNVGPGTQKGSETPARQNTRGNDIRSVSAVHTVDAICTCPTDMPANNRF